MSAHKIRLWLHVWKISILHGFTKMIKTKLTNKILLVATILASIFTIVFGIYEYRREHAFRVDILHSQLQLNNYHYLENIA